MSSRLWRSLAATLSRLVFKFLVALCYAVGFNAMLFLPLYEVRAQSRATVAGDNYSACVSVIPPT